MITEIKKTEGRSRGGRPKKAVKRSYVIKVKCTILERKVIERRAKEVGMKLSEYLRTMGLDGNIVRQQKVLPKEFLEYKAIINHTASNLNQIARKLNLTGEIKGEEKNTLLVLERELKQHIQNLQKALQP